MCIRDRLTAGIKGSLCDEETRTFAEGLMMTLNKYARDIMVKYRIHACTDVTGFGMMGHLLEMAQGSEAEIHLDLSGITFIPQALELARLGVLPAGVYRDVYKRQEQEQLLLWGMAIQPTDRPQSVQLLAQRLEQTLVSRQTVSPCLLYTSQNHYSGGDNHESKANHHPYRDPRRLRCCRASDPGGLLECVRCV